MSVTDICSKCGKYWNQHGCEASHIAPLRPFPQMPEPEQTIFQKLTERNIRFTFQGDGTPDSYDANCPDASSGNVYGTYEETMAYFDEQLNYDKGAPGDNKNASGDGGEQF